MSPNLLQLAHQATQHLSDQQLNQYFHQPVFILSAPRSGSTLLFEQLVKQQENWSIGNESHVIFSQFPHLRFENKNQDSGSLSEQHADPQTARLIKAALLFLLQNSQQQRYIDPQLSDKPQNPIIIEKTPRNALNIPFLLKIFPDARFIYLKRDPRQTIASLIEAWQLGLQTGRFATYPNLPGWHLTAWCFLLPKGWRHMINKTLPEIACFQWCESNRIIQQELKNLESDRIHSLTFNDLTNHTQQTLEATMAFINPELNTDNIQFQLTPSKTTLTPPDPDKWRKYEKEIMGLANLWSLY